jgi:hypothetical protein
MTSAGYFTNNATLFQNKKRGLPLSSEAGKITGFAPTYA